MSATRLLSSVLWTFALFAVFAPPAPAAAHAAPSLSSPTDSAATTPEQHIPVPPAPPWLTHPPGRTT